MKKLFTILFATMLAGQVWASKNYDYSIEVSGGQTLYLTNGGTITFPNMELTGPPQWIYNGYTKPAGNLVIPKDETIRGIDWWTFYGCSGLISVTIPNTITTIGENAFANQNLVFYCEAINKPSGWNSSWNSNQGTVYWGTSFVKDNMAFLVEGDNVTLTHLLNKTATTLTIPATVIYNDVEYAITDVASSAFSGCDELASINVETENIALLSDDGVLYNKDKTKLIYWPIGKVGTCTIPSTVTSIGDNAFMNCNLESITTESNADFSNAQLFFVVNDVRYKVLSQTSVEIVANAYSGDLVIPATVGYGNTFTITNIENSAFDNCELTSLTINEDFNIDLSYFALYFTKDNIRYRILDKNNVEVVANSYTGEVIISPTVSFGNTYTVASISDDIFDGCANIDYTLNKGCRYIGSEENPCLILLGANSTSITSVEIDNNCKFICSGAFNGCSSLTSIYIPESIIGIGANAFKDCNRLTRAEFASVADLCKIKFGNKYANPLNSAHHLYIGDVEITELVIPADITNLDYTFSGCDNFISVSTDSDVDYNLADLFFTKDNFRYQIINKDTVKLVKALNDKRLGDVIIPETISAGNVFTVATIGSAFYGCSNLTSVTIPNGVTDIGGQAFNGCGSLTSINIPEGIKTIKYGTFYECKNLTSITIPISVTSIESAAFYQCAKLVSIIIPDSVTTIGHVAFEGCTGLKRVVIPKSVTSIGYNAFNNEDITFYCERNGRATGWAYKYNVRLNGVYQDTYWNDNKGTIIWGIKAKMTHDYVYKVTSGEEQKISIYKYLEGNPAVIKSSETFNGIEYQVVGIDDAAYAGYTGSIVSLLEMPIALTSDPFPNSDTIYVPATSVNTYKTTTVWKRKDINPFYVVTAQSADDSKGTVQGDSLLLSSLTLTAVPAEGYHFVSWSDGNTNAVRKLTEAPNAALIATFEAHTEITDAAVAATCTEIGLTEGSHCSGCGLVFTAQENVPALGHVEVVDAAIAPTCTKTGKTEGKHCSVCNAVIVEQTEIPMVEHTIVTDAAVAATATETGLTEGSHCSVCGAVIVAQEVIPALGEQGGENTNPSTAVAELAADNLQVYAHHNTIIVENATDEIRIYNAMGALVGRDVACRVRAEINVNGAGVYIVKVGTVAKRVMIND